MLEASGGLPSYQELLELTRTQAARIAELEARVAELEQKLQAVLRAGKRQAAPFSKGPPKADPKTPGRKSGEEYGTKAHRPAPPPDQIDEVHDAPLPPACPACGGAVEPTRIDQQYQTEIPRKPIHRQFNVHVGCCVRCGHRVQGRHPLQTSDALGAAASQLGPDAQAAVVELNKELGLSHGKVRRCLRTLFGISLTRGGSAQAMLRAAGRCGPAYRVVTAALPEQEWVVLDETGWRIGGASAWLHTLVGAGLAWYGIARSRGAEVAAGVLGWGYAGTMIHDGWAAYLRFIHAVHQQCVGHIQRRCSDLLLTATRGAVVFPRRIKGLLRDALDLRDRRDAGLVSGHGLAVALGLLRGRLGRLLKNNRINPDNERLASWLSEHRRQLLVFLEHPGLDATNWRAEQALRPAVVNRKVWGGNRTDQGAHAQSVLMTVLRTWTQQGHDTLSTLSRVLRGQTPPPLLLAPP